MKAIKGFGHGLKNGQLTTKSTYKLLMDNNVPNNKIQPN